MTRYESVLSHALELSEEDRESLVIRLGLSLDLGCSPVDEQAFIAELERLSREAAADPDGDMDWEEAERDIFRDLPGS
jgi:hypothetical protein